MDEQPKLFRKSNSLFEQTQNVSRPVVMRIVVETILVRSAAISALTIPCENDARALPMLWTGSPYHGCMLTVAVRSGAVRSARNNCSEGLT